MRKVKFICIVLFALVITDNIASSQEFKFIAMTDSRGAYNGVNEPVLSAFIQHILKEQTEAKFVLFPGDMVNGSKTDPAQTVRQLEHWKNVMAPVYNNPLMVEPRVYVTVGNHEINHRYDEDNFRKQFSYVPQNGPEDEKGLTYSFDYNKAHFVFITCNRWYYGKLNDTTDDRRDWRYIKHLDWLSNDLKEARERGSKWIFVLSHEPAFPIGGHLRDCLPNLGGNLTLPLSIIRLWYLNQRGMFWDILVENNVTAYICGHEHLYGRQTVEGVYQIVTGSAGAPLYNFNPTYSNDNDNASSFEMSYNDAIPYYEVLNYNYGQCKNSQRSDDFVGFRAFNYIVFDVKDDKVVVNVYGAFPKEENNSEMGGEINMIDTFMIE